MALPSATRSRGRTDVAVDSERPGSGRLSWLGLVGGALTLVLLTLLALQWQQFSALRPLQQPDVATAAKAASEAEASYGRLREQWQQVVQTDAAPETLEGTLQALEAPLRSTVEATARAQAQHESSDAQQRQARLQSRLTLVLTMALLPLTLVFMVLALRQLHSLRQRRGALEELAQNLRSARLDAEAASLAKSTFLANMSHEIRTPFHGLMGMLSLLREAGLTPRQIDYLRTATESADHLLALLNDILDLSQLESGHLSLSPAPVTVRTLLHDVEALMRPQASAKALALHIDADPAVPERVLLDATRVKQIIFNLLSNAIKFSDHGAVVLDVRSRKDSAESPGAATLEFIVTDTGIGMDEATQSRLFSRFMQGDNSRSRRHGGTGLGLEISRNLARLMGGDIRVRSKLGEGSSFSFWLPLRPVHDHEPSADARAAAGLARSGPLQVLVAEDHPVNRQYMAALLETLGHEAMFTANGEEAVQAARERRFDVVLMDLHMPVQDGYAATQAIRALPDPSRSTVPIVALTADAFPETQARCVVVGMNDYLTKPVSPQGLATCLRRLFGSANPSGPVSDNQAVVSPPTPNAGLVDATALTLTRQALGAAKLAALIDAFLDHGPETVQRLRTAVRDAQALDLRVHAHAAKGAALNLGLTGLAQTAQALQDGAAHLPAHEIARLVQRFEAQLPATRRAVEAALDLKIGAP